MMGILVVSMRLWRGIVIWAAKEAKSLSLRTAWKGPKPKKRPPNL